MAVVASSSGCVCASVVLVKPVSIDSARLLQAIEKTSLAVTQPPTHARESGNQPLVVRGEWSVCRIDDTSMVALDASYCIRRTDRLMRLVRRFIEADRSV